ncbi:hypothetical protein D3C87_1366280 [compost metagenome]
MPCPAPIRNKGNASPDDAPASASAATMTRPSTSRAMPNPAVREPIRRAMCGLHSGPRKNPMPSGRMARPAVNASWPRPVCSYTANTRKNAASA